MLYIYISLFMNVSFQKFSNLTLILYLWQSLQEVYIIKEMEPASIIWRSPEASRVGRWTVWWRTIWRKTAPGW